MKILEKSLKSEGNMKFIEKRGKYKIYWKMREITEIIKKCEKIHENHWKVREIMNITEKWGKSWIFVMKQQGTSFKFLKKRLILISWHAHNHWRKSLQWRKQRASHRSNDSTRLMYVPFRSFICLLL